MTYSGPVMGFLILAALFAVIVLAAVIAKVSGDVREVRVARHTGVDPRVDRTTERQFAAATDAVERLDGRGEVVDHVEFDGEPTKGGSKD